MYKTDNKKCDIKINVKILTYLLSIILDTS
jgi:hypothetical protein